MRTTFVLGVCLIVGLAGCSGVEPALLGATATGGEVGVAVWKRGKLNAAQIANGETVRDAAVAALEDLELEVVRVARTGDRQWTILVEDHQARDYRVRVDERTPRLTQLQVDVGWWGPRAVADLLLREIRTKLPPEATPGDEAIHIDRVSAAP